MRGRTTALKYLVFNYLSSGEWGKERVVICAALPHEWLDLKNVVLQGSSFNEAETEKVYMSHHEDLKNDTESHMLIILDDISDADVRKICLSSFMKSVFFQSKHTRVTILWTMLDINHIPPCVYGYVDYLFLGAGVRCPEILQRGLSDILHDATTRYGMLVVTGYTGARSGSVTITVYKTKHGYMDPN